MQGEGVLRDNEETISSVKLDKTAEVMLFAGGSLNTRASYLLERFHLERFPPSGLEAVAEDKCPGAGLLQSTLV